MKKTIVLTSITLATILILFSGCGEENTTNKNNELKYNIETVSLLAKTPALSAEKCPEIGFKYDELSPEQQQACEENQLIRDKEDKSYYYEYTDDTMVMIRNLPEKYRKGYHNGQTTLTFPLKDFSTYSSIISRVLRKDGKKYFSILDESDLGNPVIDVMMNHTDLVYMEILNPQDKYKRSFQELQ